MEYFYYIFIFLFGLVMGSFMNALIYRLEVGESVFFGRSKCVFCKKTLSFFELIPILSFVFQVGRCRKCKKRISAQYPLVEFFLGVLFLFSYFKLGAFVFSFEYILSLVYIFSVLFLLGLIFVFDLKHYIIPNFAVYSLVVISFFYNLYFYGFSELGAFLLGSFIAFSFFLFLYLVSSGKWIGMGDVKFGIFMGLFLGVPNVFVGLLLSYFVGAFIGVFLLIFFKKGLKSEIPFGPFLIFGTLTAYFYGNDILNWYLNFL